MQNRLKVSYLFISLIVIGFVGGGWYMYHHMFLGVKNPITVVPEDAAIIVKIPNIERFIDDWDNDSKYHKAINELPYVKDMAEWLPTLFDKLKMMSDNFKAWDAPELIFSIHKEGYLLLFSTANLSFNNFNEQVLSTLGNEIQSSIKTIDGNYYIELVAKGKTLLIAEENGVFMFSNSKDILQQTMVNTVVSNKFTNSDSFKSLQRVSGKRADAHIFVNYHYLNQISSEENLSFYTPIWKNNNKIAKWTGLDLNLKPNEILFNGYTILNDTAVNFLEILKGQQSKGMSLPDNFPYNTKSYKHLSISDYESYFKAWKSYIKTTASWGELRKYYSQVDNGLNGKHLTITSSWWDGEMASLTTSEGKEYALFLSKKGRESFRRLSEIAHLSQPSMISMDYKGVKMKEINFKYYLYTQFGPSFENFKKAYFSVIGELVIFSHSIKDLKSYIDLLEDGHILIKNESYNTFSDNLSKNSNYTFYMKAPGSQNELVQAFSKEIRDEFNTTSLIQRDLSGVSLQLNWKNNMLYTGIFIDLSGTKSVKRSQWQVSFDSQIIAGPFKVGDHTTGGYNYIVFDEFRQIYLVNNRGDIIWKKQLEEIPMGGVHEIDYYKNGKLQYLFNTANYLYLIDLTGQLVKGYPVQLNSTATAGLSLFDYNFDKDYRILVPTENGQLYNYKKDGSLVKGWKPKNTRKPIIKPITHVVANSKDYLIAEADNGEVMMFDRKGKVRLEIRKSFSNALGSNFYSNQTNSKGMMITTDTKGYLIYIPEKGNVKSTNFGDFSKDHYFIYADFNSNGNLDFIYVDGDELVIFDKFKKRILSYVFDHEISNKPELFTVKGRKVLGVLDSEKGRLYLFNSDGLINKVVSGNTDFMIDDYKQAVVLIGKGKSLMKYSL